MKLLKYILVLVHVITSFESAAASSDSLTVHVRLDKPSGIVGELRTLTLQVNGNHIDSVSWQQVDKSFSEQVILQQGASKEVNNYFAYHIIFTSALDGDLIIEPIKLVTYKGTNANILQTDTIKVTYTPEKLITTLHNIQPVLESKALPAALYKVIITFTSLFVLLVGLGCALKYKFRSINQPKPYAHRTKALNKLSELQDQFNRSLKSGKLVSYEADEVLMDYFKNSYGLYNGFGTTMEFKSALRTLCFRDEQIQEVIEVRSSLERSKFSQEIEEATFYTTLLERVKACVYFNPDVVAQLC